MLVKVCGLRDPDNIRQVATLRPDMLGFIFYKGSPRYAGELATEVLEELPDEMKKVGVFVNEQLEFIMNIAQRYHLKYIQLHGQETPLYCSHLQKQGFQVIKALGIAEKIDFQQTKEYESVCDWLLFDTWSKQYGGTGQSFNWNWLEAYQGKLPFLLSGGITIEAISALKAIQHPCFEGVDLNSRFETSPGHKDPGLLSQFIHSLTSNF